VGSAERPGNRGNNGDALCGWRLYHDYGLASTSNACYPRFCVSKLLKYFARGGDRVVRADSDATLLSVYAAKRPNRSLTLLFVNKSPSQEARSEVEVSGYEPRVDAVAYSYGIPQDEAARTGEGAVAIVQTCASGVEDGPIPRWQVQR
jgi:alpha-N-arabinofuranosidase